MKRSHLLPSMLGILAFLLISGNDLGISIGHAIIWPLTFAGFSWWLGDLDKDEAKEETSEFLKTRIYPKRRVPFNEKISKFFEGLEI